METIKKEYTMENAITEMFDKMEKRIQNLNTLNIIVAGKTGVGKSTLINSIFSEKLADTGIGKPVTQNIKKLHKEGYPLNIYDTQGLELGEETQKTVKSQILSIIEKGMESEDINQAIHCVWYCINTESSRVEPKEIEWIRELSKENATKVPIIIILTRAFAKPTTQKMRKAILDENLDIVNVIPVLAEDYEIDDEHIVKAYGLDNLVGIMEQSLPEELQETLTRIQIVSLDSKVKAAKKHVIAAAAAATAIGATPIPFSDAALLVPTQLTMLASITVTFGFELNKAKLASILSGTIGTVGATVLGKTVVSSILKFIPGAGTVVGGIISGGTAGAITTALGEAYIGILSKVFKGEMDEKVLDTQEGREQMKEIFKEQLKINRSNTNS